MSVRSTKKLGFVCFLLWCLFITSDFLLIMYQRIVDAFEKRLLLECWYTLNLWDNESMDCYFFVFMVTLRLEIL
ncbi:unnamed protein product [Cuscuta campestris]|uniref:Uncharacterized protein n=1 Tax=Cuscuta campestris TaxID=132261 RepID=A0A484NMC1_9ASTE|nr:unnamed protein product [Cuscuta campestris]